MSEAEGDQGVTSTTNDLRLGSARAWVAPPRGRSGGGVLLYPTIFGINPPMRRFAGELAERGLTAVVWDPYRGEPLGDAIGEIIEQSKTVTDDAAVDDLRRIVDHMRSELGLERIAGIGWCFGGRIGLLSAALDDRIALLCSYNPTMLPITPIEVPGVGPTSKADHPGQTMDEMDLARRISGPVQVTRPEQDFTQPAEYEALAAALFAREAPTFYEYYPGAEHGFSYTPGAANERAQRLAWTRTLSLLSDLTDEPRQTAPSHPSSEGPA